MVAPLSWKLLHVILVGVPSDWGLIVSVASSLRVPVTTISFPERTCDGACHRTPFVDYDRATAQKFEVTLDNSSGYVDRTHFDSRTVLNLDVRLARVGRRGCIVARFEHTIYLRGASDYCLAVAKFTVIWFSLPDACHDRTVHRSACDVGDVPVLDGGCPGIASDGCACLDESTCDVEGSEVVVLHSDEVLLIDVPSSDVEDSVVVGIGPKIANQG